MSAPIDRHALINELLAVQRRLFDAGLPQTAMKVQKAIEKIGWELAAKMERQTHPPAANEH